MRKQKDFPLETIRNGIARKINDNIKYIRKDLRANCGKSVNDTQAHHCLHRLLKKYMLSNAEELLQYHIKKAFDVKST